MMGSMKPKRTSFEDVLLPTLYWLLLGVAALWLFYLCLSSMPVWMAFFIFSVAVILLAYPAALCSAALSLILTLAYMAYRRASRMFYKG